MGPCSRTILTFDTYLISSMGSSDGEDWIGREVSLPAGLPQRLQLMDPARACATRRPNRAKPGRRGALNRVLTNRGQTGLESLQQHPAVIADDEGLVALLGTP